MAQCSPHESTCSSYQKSDWRGHSQQPQLPIHLNRPLWTQLTTVAGIEGGKLSGITRPSPGSYQLASHPPASSMREEQQIVPGKPPSGRPFLAAPSTTTQGSRTTSSSLNSSSLRRAFPLMRVHLEGRTILWTSRHWQPGIATRPTHATSEAQSRNGKFRSTPTTPLGERGIFARTLFEYRNGGGRRGGRVRGQVASAFGFGEASTDLDNLRGTSTTSAWPTQPEMGAHHFSSWSRRILDRLQDYVRKHRSGRRLPLHQRPNQRRPRSIHTLKPCTLGSGFISGMSA